jgi:hypothetical protein
MKTTYSGWRVPNQPERILPVHLLRSGTEVLPPCPALQCSTERPAWRTGFRCRHIHSAVVDSTWGLTAGFELFALEKHGGGRPDARCALYTSARTPAPPFNFNLGTQSSFELNKPTVEQNFVLCQLLRPARKRAGSRSRGAYEARGATRNFRTEVGSSTRRHPVARR